MGTTTAVQNDGADALSSAPFAGINKIPTLVTLGPTQLQTTQGPTTFATNEASTLTNINVMTGTANLPQSQVNQVVAAAESTSSSNQTYTASAPASAQSVTESSGASPTGGNVTYTFGNLGTSPVDIALFACTGTNAPTTTNGTTTFTGPTTTNSTGGTTPVAGNANGQGTTTNGSTTGDNGAFIESVGGVPTAGGNPATNETRQVNSVSPTSGSVTFILNSFAPDCAIPVVFQQGAAGSANQNNLQLGANGQPTEPFGVGPSTTWTASPAITGNYADVTVNSVNPAAGTFQGGTLTALVSSPSVSVVAA
ncbi:MAG: hypothetical protein ACYCTI_02625 [Acidimicrobiales bacterium]